MIARIFHGYTSAANAEKYETLLKTEIFIGIENRKIRGYKGIQLLRRPLENEIEFTTIMWFENLEAVKDFAGTNYDTAVVPSKAKELLSRYDENSAHCELIHELTYHI